MAAARILRERAPVVGALAGRGQGGGGEGRGALPQAPASVCTGMRWFDCGLA